jgi:hypothetical protein
LTVAEAVPAAVQLCTAMRQARAPTMVGLSLARAAEEKVRT